VGLLRSVFVRWHRRACLLAKGKEHQKGPGGYTGSSVNDWFNKAVNLYLQSIAYQESLAATEFFLCTGGGGGDGKRMQRCFVCFLWRDDKIPATNRVNENCCILPLSSFAQSTYR